jgi:hypothetical protein
MAKKNSSTLILPETEIQLISDIAEYTHDPLGFVNYAYGWGEGLFQDYDGAKDWQSEFFEIIGDKLSNPETRHQPIRIATSSGHGIGKAMPLNLIVDTPQGKKTWGDLRVGDMVFARNGKPTLITATKHYKNAPMFKVTFDDGSSTLVSSGHLWSVRISKSLYEFETIETLLMKDKIDIGFSLEIPSYSPIEFWNGNSIKKRKSMLEDIINKHWYEITGSYYKLIVDSKKEAEMVMNLARSLGGKSYISEGFVFIHISLSTVDKVRTNREIVSVDPVESMDCMCITVDSDDGLYLANDFIVTHNSAFMGMLCNWALSTCEDTKIVITSNTETQLRTKTFPELKKWFRSSINYHWWRDTATGVFSNDAKHMDQWRIDAVPWSEHNTEAFAGLHNRGKRIVLLFDEASAIADKVWEVAEGALTDEGTEIIWIALGNPTRPNGRFYECFHKYRHRWITKQIDSRTVEGTNLKQAQEWADDFGEDSDFFKVRVRGQFPSSSAMQFIEMNIIDGASGRHLRKEQYQHAPVIITCDPSWTGEDELIIGMRQGLYFRVLEVMPKNENDSIPATRIAHWQDELDADATFIDMGYGTGIHSFLKTWGRKSELVAFGSKSGKKGYSNKRTEMWAEMREWLRDGGAIPPTTDKNGSTLYEELKAPERLPMIKDGIIALESKESIKKRLGFSPNIADALALSFARPVRKRDKMKSQQANSYGSNYDPTEY